MNKYIVTTVNTHYYQKNYIIDSCILPQFIMRQLNDRHILRVIVEKAAPEMLERFGIEDEELQGKNKYDIRKVK